MVLGKMKEVAEGYLGKKWVAAVRNRLDVLH